MTEGEMHSVEMSTLYELRLIFSNGDKKEYTKDEIVELLDKTAMVKEQENKELKEKSKEEPKGDNKPKQVHEAKDRDIKIDSGKVGDINVKLIYHRMKDNSKQYRIFLSKKIDGKRKRTRLNNEETKKIDRDEEKMIDYYNQIISGKIKVQVG